jgi:hypothetical protein
MNNLKDVYPVYMSLEHLEMLPKIVGGWAEGSRILCLGVLDERIKSDNITVVDPQKVYEIFGMDTKLPYEECTFDNCICIDVLGSVENPFLLSRDIYRVLVPGGNMYVEAPFLSPYTTSENDYYRFTPRGLYKLFDKMDVHSIGIANGPGSAVHWITSIYDALRFDVDGDYETMGTRVANPDYEISRKVLGMHNEYLKYTDELYSRKEHACTIACSLYMMASKPKDK